MISIDLPSAPLSAYVAEAVCLSSLPELIAGIIKIPPPDSSSNAPSEMTFGELICTEADRENIAYIISTMAENGKLKLLFSYKSELKQRGAEINHVHPLRLLGVVFSDPYLKECMDRIYDDYFKWDGFLNGEGDGLIQSLQRHASQGRIEVYLNDFAKQVGADPEIVKGYAKSSDWENLVRYLLKI